MTTASTKQRARKAKRARAADTPAAIKALDADGAAAAGDAAATTVTTPEISRRAWWIASIVILLVAALLRLYALELKPLHHDEGVNGFFLTRLFRDGIYRYDPSNYHGPTLYYFALLPVYALGLNTIAIRLVTVVFGLATIALVLFGLRRRIGAIGALAAATLLAVSPGAVFLSRYFIHEMLFVFFTLGLVVASLKYYDTARPVYLILASVSAALLFATKETAFISIGVLMLATALAWVYIRLKMRLGWYPFKYLSGRKRGAKSVPGRPDADVARDVSEELARFGRPSRVITWLLTALAVFLFINVLFYSSFFTYKQGVSAALETFKIWTKTGTSDFHRKPFYTYVIWLLQEEALLLMLGALGAALALWWARRRFAVFAAAWSFGILAAYSLVPYKTPWLVLNFTLPLAISGGYAINAIYGWNGQQTVKRAVAIGLMACAVAMGTYQTVVLNFSQYDNDRYPYVYAHTMRDINQLVGEIDRLAARAGTGKETDIAIASPDYWPLPWYLREYKRVGFQGRVGDFKEAIVIGSEAQDSQLKSRLGENYSRLGGYVLRPGANLVLYIRRDMVKP